MSLTVSRLRAFLGEAADGSALEFLPDFLELGPVQELFARFLDGSALEVRDVAVDVEALAVTGAVTLLGQVESAADVRFLPDLDEENVVGVRVDVVLLPDGPGLPPEIADVPELLARLKLGPPHLVFGVEPGPDGGAQPRVGLGIEILFPTPEADPRPYLWGYPPLWPGQCWSFGSNFADVPFPSLADLLEFAQLPGAGFELPGDILGEGLTALRDLAVTFADTRDSAARETGRPVEIDWRALRLGIGIDHSWAPFPGVLELEELSAVFTVADPLGAPRVATEIGGRVTLASDIVVDVEVALPERSFSGELAQPAPLGALLNDRFPGIPIPDDMTISTLRIWGELDAASPTHGYGIDCALENIWQITDDIGLESIALTLADQAGDKSAGLSAVWQLGEGTLDVVGEWVAGADWTFRATALGIQPFEILDAVGIDTPEALADLEFEELSVAFDSAGHFSFVCAAAMGLGEESQGTLTVTFDADRAGGSIAISGQLQLVVPLDEDTRRVLDFQVDFVSAQSGRTLTAGWTGDPGLGIDELARAVGLELPTGLPSGLLPVLTSLVLRRDLDSGRTVVAAGTEGGSGIALVVLPQANPPQTAPQTQIQTYVETLAPTQPPPPSARRVLLVNVALDVFLSEMPLIGGGVPPAADFGVRSVLLCAVDSPISVEQRALVDAELEFLAAYTGVAQPRLPRLTDSGILPRGVYLALECEVGGKPFASPTVPLTGGGAPGSGPNPGPGQGAPAVTGSVPVGSPLAVREVEAAPDTPRPAAPLGRAIGPLFVRSVGIAFDGGTAWLNVSGELTALGLRMSVEKLAIGVALGGGFALDFRLDGLGVDFERPPLRVAGSLVRRTPAPGVDLDIAGILIVEMPQFGVTALGGYQRRTDGSPSLFVFGRGRAALGGPPPFRVQGVAAGFGFNTAMKLPTGSQVATFPLVDGLDGGLSDDPLAVLDALTEQWVTFHQGELWLAAGLDFSSFELIQGRLLLYLQVGSGLVLGLIGTARAAFPPVGKAIAAVNLQMSVVYDSRRGVFSATAQLYDSYVIDPSCVLTGGFAFTQWFAPSEYAGDFVLTVGGYHPDFTAPAHYPDVPRLGFQWSLGVVEITGTAFFALTPSAIMTGGTLDVRYSAGPVKAWLTAYAHVLISWKPVYFRVGIGITIGASLKLLFTFKAELGASLDLWGPPTGGTVTAKFAFVTVTINIGRGRSDPAFIGWDEFTELLPPGERVLRIAVPHGLLADAEPPEGRLADERSDGSLDAPWLIDAGGATFLVETSVPASSTTFQDEVPQTGNKLDIRPMDRTQLESPLTVRVARNVAVRGAAALWRPLENDGSWQATALPGAVPSALWGKPDGYDPLDPDDQLLPGRGVGMSIVIPPPVCTNPIPPAPVLESSIAYELMDDVLNPLDPDAPPSGDEAHTSPDTAVGLVADTIAASGVAAARGRLRSALDALLAPGPSAPDSSRAYSSRADTPGGGPLPDEPLDGFVRLIGESGLADAPLLIGTAAGRTS